MAKRKPSHPSLGSHQISVSGQGEPDANDSRTVTTPPTGSSSSADVSVTYQHTIDLDGVIARRLNTDEMGPTSGISLLLVQALNKPANGETVMPSSYFDVFSNDEKDRRSKVERIPCEVMFTVFERVWDAWIAMRPHVGQKQPHSRAASIDVSKTFGMGCGLSPHGRLCGTIHIGRNDFEIGSFWMEEFVYLLAKAFAFLGIESQRTPAAWVAETGHDPHPHGGKLTI